MGRDETDDGTGRTTGRDRRRDGTDDEMGQTTGWEGRWDDQTKSAASRVTFCEAPPQLSKLASGGRDAGLDVSSDRTGSLQVVVLEPSMHAYIH